MHYLARRLGVLEGLGQGRDADADVADGEVVVRAADQGVNSIAFPSIIYKD